MTLSAPKTNFPSFFLLTLFAFNSAKFFEIISGEAFSFNKLFFTNYSSTFDGSDIQLIPFDCKIFFLTKLFEANIILLTISCT